MSVLFLPLFLLFCPHADRIVLLSKPCHPEQSEGPAFALAFALALAVLSVIPEGNLLLLSSQSKPHASAPSLPSPLRQGWEPQMPVLFLPLFLLFYSHADRIVLLSEAEPDPQRQVFVVGVVVAKSKDLLYLCSCSCCSVCHSQRESASVLPK